MNINSIENIIKMCDGCCAFIIGRKSREPLLKCGHSSARKTENGDIEQCPCTFCLLKVICDNICEEYKTYHEKFYM